MISSIVRSLSTCGLFWKGRGNERTEDPTRIKTERVANRHFPRISNFFEKLKNYFPFSWFFSKRKVTPELPTVPETPLVPESSLESESPISPKSPAEQADDADCLCKKLAKCFEKCFQNFLIFNQKEEIGTVDEGAVNLEREKSCSMDSSHLERKEEIGTVDEGAVNPERRLIKGEELEKLFISNTNLRNVYEKFSQKFQGSSEGTANTFQLSVFKGNVEQAPTSWKVYHHDGENIEQEKKGFYLCPIKETDGIENTMDLELTNINGAEDVHSLSLKEIFVSEKTGSISLVFNIQGENIDSDTSLKAFKKFIVTYTSYKVIGDQAIFTPFRIYKALFLGLL